MPDRLNAEELPQLCLNPVFAILTMAYHITMLLLTFKRPADAPRLSIGYTIVAYLLSLAWLGAYFAMSVILSNRETEFKIFGLWVLIPQTMRVPQKIQIMLDPFECVIIGNIAIKSTMERRRWPDEGKEPGLVGEC
ncbi:hypothetical protein GALMADRAFT_236436 [Galerina marginata CBS 339.88]|uniref:Uncharacterized protein n=1 Tax=Galerina marginata (strain CBS 339.88) TaxID=685588 RepID=A0A067TVK0_GALM3|nr:hypothetical protein GALMADRAFT_236436 [Galerina marginata CBS 339.88]